MSSAIAAGPAVPTPLPDDAGKPVDDRIKSANEGAKSASDKAKSRARSDDATPHEEDIEADE